MSEVMFGRVVDLASHVVLRDIAATEELKAIRLRIEAILSSRDEAGRHSRQAPQRNKYIACISAHGMVYKQ
jgi:hypothetical protein